MKNVLFKNSIKQIKNTHRRFVSILVMALLGVGFFAGLYATGPDMKESLDKYLDETDMYDISIVSTLGLTDEDIDQIKNADGLETAYGIKEKDAEVTIADKEFVMNFIDYNEKVNRPVIVEGRMPENNSECIIDQRFCNTGTCKVGDTLTIKDDENNFNNDKLTITKRKNYVYQVLKAFKYIHSKGRLHRDINPKNILIKIYDDVPVVEISDFGLIKQEESTLTTVNTDFKGWFNDPNLRIIGFDKYSMCHEIYALTMTIYYLMTGKTNTTKIENKNLQEFVKRGMNTDCSKRYKDVEELLKEFRKI